MGDNNKKVVFILFFASGISGLIYEVVWLRILSRVLGVTTYATAITLAAFMAGLAIGSFLFGKFADKHQDQLKIYTFLQLAIGIVAYILPSLFKAMAPFYKYIYTVTGNNAVFLSIIRACISFACLLIPTTLMGGTLPVLSAYMIKNKRTFGKDFSLLYGLNTLGAVFGVIISGFITIGTIGEWNTILLGVSINLVVGIIALIIYRDEKKTSASGSKSILKDNIAISPYPDKVRNIVLISILISGFTALAYEVIWTRQLILFLYTSIYAFSGMLAIFLTGIALGSIAINKYIDRVKTPLLFFGILELIVGVLSILGLYLFSPLDRGPLSRTIAPAILVFPLALSFGIIFPIASLCYTKSVHKTGASVGMLCGFNTIGNVAGAILTGFLFINILGSSKAVIFLSLVNIALGFILLWSEPQKSNIYKARFLLIVPLLFLLLAGFKGKDPFLNVIEDRIKKGAGTYEIFYNKECAEGTVTCYSKNNLKNLLINGVGQTHILTETKLMAHLPIALAKEPKKLLVICFGMGTTVRSASIYDDLDITSVELVPQLYKCFKFFHSDADKVLNRKNINLVSEDGRNFLLLSQDKYDVITVDPSPPIYSAGTVNLYSQEFFSLCKEHLNPNGGVMSLWCPTLWRYTREDPGLWILKTFASVFPNVTVWKGPHDWGMYIIGMLGNNTIDKTKIERAFKNPELLKDISEYDQSCSTASQLLNLLILDNRGVAFITKDAPIITDNFPYTEFPSISLHKLRSFLKRPAP